MVFPIKLCDQCLRRIRKLRVGALGRLDLSEVDQVPRGNVYGGKDLVQGEYRCEKGGVGSGDRGELDLFLGFYPHRSILVQKIHVFGTQNLLEQHRAILGDDLKIPLKISQVEHRIERGDRIENHVLLRLKLHERPSLRASILIFQVENGPRRF